MALSCVSPLYISKPPNHLQSLSKPFTVVCRIEPQRENYCRGEANAESKKWQRLVSTALAAAVVTLSPVMPAVADLNKYEVEMRGEIGIGSAAQFGSANLRKAVHVNENFRRANFTSADMRESDFSGSTFNGAYLEKAVAYKASFTDSKMYLSTKLGDGTTVCLDVDSSDDIVTNSCKCLSRDYMCDPGSQWFKIANSTDISSKPILRLAPTWISYLNDGLHQREDE